MIDWLYRTSLEVTLLIGLVLILRPIVRHQLGAHIAYWLWLIPLARCFLWRKPEIPAAVMEKISMPNGDVLLRIFPNPENFYIPDNIPVDWIWLTGFAFWLVIRILGWRHLQVFLREKSTAIELPSKLKQFVVSKNYHQEIKFFLTDIASAPFVTGLVKPKIYLPAQFFEGYSLIQQHCILDHELTHLKRKDLWSQIIGELVRAIFWFNPVVHIAWSAFREDQELACDQQVLRFCNDNQRYEYGRALFKGFHAHILPATLAFFSQKKERFIMLEKHKNSTFNNAVGLTLCLMIGVFSLTKAPVAVAHQSAWSDEKMTFNFHEIPLSALARMIFGFAEQEVVGLEPLNSTLVTVAVDSVTPLNAISILLKCHGYVMEFDTDHYRVKQLGEVGAAMGRAKECINTGFGDKLAKDSEAFQPSDDANIIQPARLLVTFDNGAGKMSYLKETNQLSFEVKELALNEFIATVFNWADKDVVGLAQLDKFKLTMKQENTQAYQVASNVLNCYGFSIEQKQDHYRLLVNQGQTINASESQLCINAFAK